MRSAQMLSEFDCGEGEYVTNLTAVDVDSCTPRTTMALSYLGAAEYPCRSRQAGKRCRSGYSCPHPPAPMRTASIRTRW